MQHITLKAVAEQVTDQGVFEAVISTESVDRERDVVSAKAMVASLKAWNRPIPLAWDHSTKAEDIIGSIEPMTVRAVEGEVVAQGKVDIESQVGTEAWRSFKSRAIGFSFGYLPLKSQTREGGGRYITELDVFEVTATPTPMNNDTRVLSTKSAKPSELPGVLEELAEQVEQGKLDAKAAAEQLRAAAERLGELQGAQQEVRDLKAAYAELKLGLMAEGVALPQSSTAEAKELGQEPERAIPPDEMAGAESGELKAVWSAAMINDLPDSAFLYVAPGGNKDEEGKTTPRSLRYFPYKDSNGNVDLPHLRNALARIPQSNLSQAVKDRLTSKAQQILDNANKAIDDAQDDDPPLEPGKSVAQEPAASTHAEDHRAVYALVTEGIDVGQPREAKAPPKPPELPEIAELRRGYYDLILETLVGPPEEGST